MELTVSKSQDCGEYGVCVCVCIHVHVFALVFAGMEREPHSHSSDAIDRYG